MSIGVLVMAYGGPDNLDEVEPYLLDVRGYRPTAPAIIQEVRERYQLIGGRSPILERTQAQADALQSALNSASQPGMYRVYVGMRHWKPYIPDTLAEMGRDGVQHVVGLVMAPHASRMSTGAYYKKVFAAAEPLDVQVIKQWHLLPGYLDSLESRVRDALLRFPVEIRSRVPVVFTAHSLPMRILSWNDPYPRQLGETVAALAARLAPQPYRFAYQSAAMTPDPWLGPDAGEIIDQIAREGGQHVLIAPIGFVCEHVEILYDIDVVFKAQAQGLGMHLERIEMLNDAPQMIAGLANLVHRRALKAGWVPERVV